MRIGVRRIAPHVAEQESAGYGGHGRDLRLLADLRALMLIDRRSAAPHNDSKSVSCLRAPTESPREGKGGTTMSIAATQSRRLGLALGAVLMALALALAVPASASAHG